VHANEKVLRAALDVIAAGDAAAFAEMAADDMVVHVPGRSRMARDLHGRSVRGGAWNGAT
jgi:ketosteroid isomerase-like protein